VDAVFQGREGQQERVKARVADAPSLSYMGGWESQACSSTSTSWRPSGKLWGQVFPLLLEGFPKETLGLAGWALEDMVCLAH
jgi:hypothetical protein